METLLISLSRVCCFRNFPFPCGPCSWVNMKPWVNFFLLLLFLFFLFLNTKIPSSVNIECLCSLKVILNACNFRMSTGVGSCCVLCHWLNIIFANWCNITIMMALRQMENMNVPSFCYKSGWGETSLSLLTHMWFVFLQVIFSWNL